MDTWSLTFNPGTGIVSYRAEDVQGQLWDVEGTTKTKHVITGGGDPPVSPSARASFGRFSRPSYRDPLDEEGLQPERTVCGVETRDYQLIGKVPVRIHSWLGGSAICKGQKTLRSYHDIWGLWIWNGTTRYVAQDRGRKMLTGGLWYLARDNERGNGYTELRDVFYIRNSVFARGLTWEKGGPVWYYIYEGATGPFAEQRKGPFDANHAGKLQVVDGKWLFAAARANKPKSSESLEE